MDAGDALALFVAGVALGATAVAVLAAARRQSAGRSPGLASASAERLTAAWSLAELGSAPAPLLLARDLDAAGLEVPAGSRAVVSGRAHPVLLRSCQVRRPADGAPVPVEVAVAAGGGRAILFPAGPRPGALALAVSEPALAARLAALAEAAWAAATPYVERRALADLAGEPGLPVEAEGLVAQVVPRAGGAGVLLRLEDGGHSAAVHAARDEGLAGRRVRVQGRLARDAGGYPVVEADRLVALD